MGLFHRNENDANFAGGSRNIIEPIQRQTDVDALVYLAPGRTSIRALSLP